MKKIVLFALAAIMMAGCTDKEPKQPKRFVVLHHKNICDTIVTSSYHYYYKERVLDAKEGGSFTQVEYVKAIE